MTSSTKDKKYTGKDFFISPVHDAIAIGLDKKEFENIYKEGFDFNIKSPNARNNFIFSALKYKNYRALEALPDFIDVNESNIYGETPLMWACWNGNQKQVEVLLRKGADPNMRKTSSYANQTGSKRQQELMTPLGWIKNSIGHEHISHEQRIKIYQMLFEAGADMNSRSIPSGYTQYMWESYKGDVRAMEFLHKNCSVDPFIRDAKGKSALSWSVYGRFFDLEGALARFSYNLLLFKKRYDETHDMDYVKELYHIKKWLMSREREHINGCRTMINLASIFGEEIHSKNEEGDIFYPLKANKSNSYWNDNRLTNGSIADDAEVTRSIMPIYHIFLEVNREIERIGSNFMHHENPAMHLRT